MFSKLFRLAFSIALLCSFFDNNLSATNSLKSEIDETEKKIVLRKRAAYQNSKSHKGQLLDLHKLPEAVTGPIYKGNFFILPKDMQDYIINLTSPFTFRSLNTLYNYYVTGIPRKYIGDHTTNIQPKHQKFFRHYKIRNLEMSELKNAPNFIPSTSELRIRLDTVSLHDINDIAKSKIIKSLIINQKFDNHYINFIDIKEKLMMFIKRNNHIQKLTIFESCFDAECVKEISKKGVITSLSVRKYIINSSFNDDFYHALANIPQLKKLELTTSATPQQLALMTNHPTLEHLIIMPTEIDYDQIMSFLSMPKLKYFYSLTKDLTKEQKQKLKEIAKSRNINLHLHKGPKKL